MRRDGPRKSIWGCEVIPTYSEPDFKNYVHDDSGDDNDNYDDTEQLWKIGDNETEHQSLLVIKSH